MLSLGGQTDGRKSTQTLLISCHIKHIKRGHHDRGSSLRGALASPHATDSRKTPTTGQRCMNSWSNCAELRQEILQKLPQNHTWCQPILQVESQHGGTKKKLALRHSTVHDLHLSTEDRKKSAYLIHRHHFYRLLSSWHGSTTRLAPHVQYGERLPFQSLLLSPFPWFLLYFNQTLFTCIVVLSCSYDSFPQCTCLVSSVGFLTFSCPSADFWALFCLYAADAWIFFLDLYLAIMKFVSVSVKVPGSRFGKSLWRFQTALVWEAYWLVKGRQSARFWYAC